MTSAETNPEQYAIWWTDDEDAQRVPHDAQLPVYIGVKFLERRTMQQRENPVACAAASDCEGRIVLDRTKPAAGYVYRAHGVIFRRADLAVVLTMPGFVTDLDMNLLAASAGKDWIERILDGD